MVSSLENAFAYSETGPPGTSAPVPDRGGMLQIG